jgi:hypothetical protein
MEDFMQDYGPKKVALGIENQNTNIIRLHQYIYYGTNDHDLNRYKYGVISSITMPAHK